MGLAAEQLDGGEKSGLGASFSHPLTSSQKENGAHVGEAIAGSWWRFWLALDEGSGWLGIAIIGFLLSSLVVWLAWMRFGRKKPSAPVALPSDSAQPQPETA